MDLIDRQDAIDAMAELQGRASTKAELKGISKAWKQIKQLPSAQPEQRWIPVSERLPDDTTYENHLVVVYCTMSGTVDVGWYEAFFKKWWRLEPDEEIREEVIAWMPLPDAYKEDK